MEFATYQQFLAQVDADLAPSELHGRMTGQLCAHKTSRQDRINLYSQWTGVTLTESDAAMFEKLYEETEEALGDYSDFELRLLLPDEGTAINDRVNAIAGWCQGFLLGLGSVADSGRPGEDAREMLSDLVTIAGLDEEVPEGEDNERDLMQIEEYLRIAALTVYADLNGQ